MNKDPRERLIIEALQEFKGQPITEELVDAMVKKIVREFRKRPEVLIADGTQGMRRGE